MVRQIVVFSFAEAVGEAQRQQVIAGLNRFPALFPQIKTWALGRNVSKRDRRYQYGFVAEFESEAALETYLDDPRHEAFVRDEFRPAVAERAIVTLAAEG
jgi:2,3-dihydroxy-p-cumate/2,3-dihydroxybenzoate 3,4-dioxygenase